MNVKVKYGIKDDTQVKTFTDSIVIEFDWWIHILRYFNFEPSFKLRWCRARDLFGSQIPMTTRGFEQSISCIQSHHLTH